jgi:DNA replication protein DnaC
MATIDTDDSRLPGEDKIRLAGVDKVMGDAVSYIRRCHLESTKPLLLVGGKGSGKTIIAKAIAERLETDRAILSGMLTRLHS